MAIIKLKDVEKGMVLASDVYNFQGLLLLKNNVSLSDKSIRLLKCWGVNTVEIKGDEKNNGSIKNRSDDKERLIKSRITEKFMSLMGDPAMLEIMNAAIDILIKRNTEYEK